MVKEGVAEVVAQSLIEAAVHLVAKFDVDNLAQQSTVLQCVGAVAVLEHASHGGVKHNVHHDVVAGDLRLWQEVQVAGSCDIVDTLVGFGNVIVGTIGEREELCLLNVANGLGPAQATVDAVGLAQVVVDLVDSFLVVDEIVVVASEGVAVLVDVAVVVAQEHAVAAPGV